MGHGDVLCVRITHGTHPGIPEGGRGAVKEGDDVLSRRVIWRGGARREPLKTKGTRSEAVNKKLTFIVTS